MSSDSQTHTQALIQFGFDEGFRKGFAQGRDETLLESQGEARREGYYEGFDEGLAQGRDEGSLNRARESALRMRSQGVPASKIAEYLDVPIERVRQWLAAKEETASQQPQSRPTIVDMGSFGLALTRSFYNKGFPRGRDEGSLRIARESALRMRSQGVPDSQIAEYLEVSVELVRQWFAEASQHASSAPNVADANETETANQQTENEEEDEEEEFFGLKLAQQRIDEWFDKGVKDGIRNRAHDSTLRMHAHGVPVSKIASYLDFPIEAVQWWIAEKEQER